MLPHLFFLTPWRAHICRFVTKVFHPNVHFKTGEICLDVLKDTWTPIYTLESTCRTIISLLACPEASSPLNCDAGNLIRAGDQVGYESMARMYTLEYAEMVDQGTGATTAQEPKALSPTKVKSA